MWTMDYAEQLDRTRRHQLLSEPSVFALSLRYRYADTGETVTVPNVWQNQTPEMRATALRARADVLEKSAGALASELPGGVHAGEAEDVIERVRTEVNRLRRQALLMEQTGQVLE